MQSSGRNRGDTAVKVRHCRNRDACGIHDEAGHVVVWLFVLIMLVATGIGVYWIATNYEPPAALQEPVAQTEAADADESAEEQALLAELEHVLEKVQAGEITVNDAIFRVERVVNKLTGDLHERGLTIFTAIKTIKAERVAAECEKVTAQFTERLEAGGPESALLYLAGYSSVFMNETSGLRLALKRQAQALVEEREQRRHQVLSVVAEHVSKANFVAAVKHLTESEFSFEYSQLVAAMEEAQVGGQRILASFQDQVGQVVAVGINGERRDLKIVGLSNNVVLVEWSANGATRQGRVGLTQLDVGECARRLESFSAEARAMYVGALALYKQEFPEALRQFASAGALAQALKSEVEQRLALKREAAEERMAAQAKREAEAAAHLVFKDGKLGELEKLMFASTGLAHDSGVARELAIACVKANHVERGQAALQRFIRHYFETNADKVIYKTTELDAITAACDAWMLLKNCFATAGFRNPEVVEWFMRDNDRLQVIVEAVREGVDWPRAAGIIEQLYHHDPETRNEYFDMIMAFAAVWDSPRPFPHGQAGGNELSYQPALSERYDYYKGIYEGNSAVPFSRLNCETLMLVVDTPVPVSELSWARENVRGALGAWGKKFNEIRYDHARLEDGQYNWLDGTYTLANIKRRGGICTDQAYYGMMTARAHGIPAMLFSGMGKRGAHAWFGYMKSEKHWEMEAGRYEYDEYTIGHAVDPRTNRRMTDHEATFKCDSLFRTRDFHEASRYCRIADVCNQLELDAATMFFIEKSLRRVDVNPRTWDVYESLLQRTSRSDELVAVLERRYEKFSSMLDERCATVIRLCTLLEKTGNQEKANKLFEYEKRYFGRRRYDLAEAVFKAQIATLTEPGELQQKMDMFEDYLKDNMDQGEKLLGHIAQYIETAKTIGKAKESARFMNRFVRRFDSGNTDAKAKVQSLVQRAEANAERD